MIHIFINILIFTLIFVFVIILTYQLFIPHYKLETFKNNDTNSKRNKNSYNADHDTNAAFILAQQNAGNINILKDRVGHLEVLKNQVIDNSNKIKLLESDLQDILQRQIHIASKNTRPNISRN
jgi:hypothetical protein